MHVYSFQQIEKKSFICINIFFKVETIDDKQLAVPGSSTSPFFGVWRVLKFRLSGGWEKFELSQAEGRLPENNSFVLKRVQNIRLKLAPPKTIYRFLQKLLFCQQFSFLKKIGHKKNYSTYNGQKNVQTDQSRQKKKPFKKLFLCFEKYFFGQVFFWIF